MPEPNHYHNVRMKGFASRTTLESALAWIDSQLPKFDQLPHESVGLHSAAGRVLAEKLVSRANVPGFSRSMMDGYALRASETHGASAYNPLPLRIVGTSMPGKAFQGCVESGEAISIMTGAPMPQGADAVLPAEYAEVQGGQSLLVSGELSVGKHVGTVGEDVRAGNVVLEPGRLLRPQDLGVLSSIGCKEISVVRSPAVRVLITGNEVLPAGEVPQGFQITDANGPMLGALVARDGGISIIPSIVPDDPEALISEFKQPADVILVSGGSSVGIEDHAPRLLSELGTLAIHGVAMRPSSPAGMGMIDGSFVFLLPGNPVSCLCAYDFFAGPAIRSLGGRNKPWPYRSMIATLSRKLVSTVGRVDYARVKIDGQQAEPIAISGASILSSTTYADGFVVIPADSEGYAAGCDVEVWLY
jgi:molybdopterin molybdotransferase